MELWKKGMIKNKIVYSDIFPDVKIQKGMEL